MPLEEPGDVIGRNSDGTLQAGFTFVRHGGNVVAVVQRIGFGCAIDVRQSKITDLVASSSGMKPVHPIR